MTFVGGRRGGRSLRTPRQRRCDFSAEEKDGGGDLMTSGWMRMMGGDDSGDSPQQVARRARRELDRTTLDKLKALLTEEQQDKLPERDQQANPWGGFGGGGGRRGN